MKSLEIFNNPLLESITVSDEDYYDITFYNLNDYVIIRGKLFSILL